MQIHTNSYQTILDELYSQTYPESYHIILEFKELHRIVIEVDEGISMIE